MGLQQSAVACRVMPWHDTNSPRIRANIRDRGTLHAPAQRASIFDNDTTGIRS